MPTVSLIYIDVNRKRMTGRNMTVHNKGRIEKCAAAGDTVVWGMRICAVAPGSVLPSSVSVRSVGKIGRAEQPALHQNGTILGIEKSLCDSNVTGSDITT